MNNILDKNFIQSQERSEVFDKELIERKALDFLAGIEKLEEVLADLDNEIVTNAESFNHFKSLEGPARRKQQYIRYFWQDMHSLAEADRKFWKKMGPVEDVEEFQEIAQAMIKFDREGMSKVDSDVSHLVSAMEYILNSEASSLHLKIGYSLADLCILSVWWLGAQTKTSISNDEKIYSSHPSFKDRFMRFAYSDLIRVVDSKSSFYNPDAHNKKAHLHFQGHGVNAHMYFTQAHTDSKVSDPGLQSYVFMSQHKNDNSLKYIEI